MPTTNDSDFNIAARILDECVQVIEGRQVLRYTKAAEIIAGYVQYRLDEELVSELNK